MFRKKLLFVLIMLLVLVFVSGNAFAAGLPRITGSGHVYDTDGTYRVATVAVLMLPNGTIQSEINGVVLMDDTAVVHGDIDCVRIFEIAGVEGQGAVISGWSRIEKNFPPGVPIPAYVVMAVFDGGEGNEAGDIFSRGIPVPNPEYLNCNDPFPWPLNPVDNGNVQIDW